MQGSEAVRLVYSPLVSRRVERTPATYRELRDFAVPDRLSADSECLGPSRLGVPPMSDITQILNAIEQGDPCAAQQLLPLVYAELRRLAAAQLAREKPGQTLEATALVHEAYLRLVGDQQFAN